MLFSFLLALRFFCQQCLHHIGVRALEFLTYFFPLTLIIDSQKSCFMRSQREMKGQSKGVYFLGLGKKALLTSQYAPPPTQSGKPRWGLQ